MWKVWIGHKPMGIAGMVCFALLLHFPWNPQGHLGTDSNSVLHLDWMLEFFSKPLLTMGLNAGCSLLLAFLFHGMLNRLNVFNRTTYFPALFVVLISGSFPTAFWDFPMWWTLLLVCWSLRGVFGGPGTDNQTGAFFQSGLLLGLAQFGTLTALAFTPGFLLASVWIRRIQAKHFIVFLAGNALPWVYLLTFWFVGWDGKSPLDLDWKVAFEIQPQWQQYTWWAWIIPSWLLLMSLASFFDFTAINTGHRAIERVAAKWFGLLFWAGLIAAYVHPGLFLNYLPLLSLPLAFFFSMFFLNLKKTWKGYFWLGSWLGLLLLVRLFN